jgi:hypothetical protein
VSKCERAGYGERTRCCPYVCMPLMACCGDSPPDSSHRRSQWYALGISGTALFVGHNYGQCSGPCVRCTGSADKASGCHIHPRDRHRNHPGRCGNVSLLRVRREEEVGTI